MKALLIVATTSLFALRCSCQSNDTLSAVQQRRNTVAKFSKASFPKRSWNDTELDKLRKVLFINYDKYARPQQHDDITTVQIGLKIWFLEANEVNSTLSVASRLILSWKDAKLKWNPDDFGGIEEFKAMDHEIWQPNVYLYNRASSSAEAVFRYGNPYSLIFSNGEVLWVPPTKFDVLCNFDLYYWPFDTQHCFVRFVSWTNSGKDIKLELYDKELDFKFLVTSWNLNVTSNVWADFDEQKCCEMSFYNAQFNLTLERISAPYVALAIIPVIAVICLILTQYWMPPRSGQRIILNCFTAIIIILFLAFFTRYITAIGSKTPLIVTFYSTSLFLVCFGMLESIIVRLLLNHKHKQSPPEFIKKFLKQQIGKFLLMNTYTSQLNLSNRGSTTEELREYQHNEFEDAKTEEMDEMIKRSSVRKKTNGAEFEWNVLVLAIDRIFFTIYNLIFLVFAMVYTF